jgi:hypothetical protein
VLAAIIAIQLTIISLHGQGHRTARGTVYYSSNEVAAGAAVQLKDVVTLQVISQITDSHGRYNFHSLDPDRDYEIVATKRGYWSSTHRVSRFSSKSVTTVDLHLKPGSEEK